LSKYPAVPGSGSSLPVINMLWIGGPIGYIERLSIVSFLTAGHPVHLHAYDEVGEVPAGVTLVDAALTAPRQQILKLRYRKSGSFALAANYFRLLLQLQRKGIWADIDMVALAPFDFPDETLFGFEAPRRVNNAVLRLPPDSPALLELLAEFRPNAVPWWIPDQRKRQLALRRFFRIPFGPQDHRWGVYGPTGLTALATKHGLIDRAQPIDVFYPVHYRKVRALFEPGSTIETFTSERTVAVHLWNNKLGELRRAPPSGDTAAGRLLRRFGV
jgi:hypothetical protein